VDDALRTRLSRWFAVVEVDDDRIQGPAVTCLRELVDMLDAVDPSRVDQRRSGVRSHGHGWTVEAGVEVHLAHDTDESADVRLVIGERDAIVDWLSTHEHVLPEEGDEGRPWTAMVVDVVAAAIRGEYEVEQHYRGDRLIKTRIVDVAADHPRVVSTTGSLLGLLPWFGKKRVESRRLDYRPRGRSGQSQE
jgi:hypothetical protein